jgi:RNA polymerase sigma factor (sigma-70 family)
MTEELFGLGDPVIRRLQRAFADQEPAIDLAAVMQGAARYQAGEPPGAHDPPPPGHGLTQADLVAARRREPAAVTRVYTAYAPALFRFFMAAVGDRHQAEDLTGTTFVSAIEALPRFRGPVEALGGWLFQIARHDLYDYRRRQARSRIEPLEDDLGETAAAASAPEVLGQESGVETALGSVPAAPDDQRLDLHLMAPQLFGWLLDMAHHTTHPALKRLSSREREILGLLAKGWSNRRIAEECYLSLNTVRTHVQNILIKLGVHSKLEAVAFALEYGWEHAAEDPDQSAMERLEGNRVMAALQQLSPDQREVLLLHMVAGLTTPEVAAAVGKSVGQVKALRHRGLASLARALGLHDAEQPQERPSSLDPEHLANQEKHQG